MTIVCDCELQPVGHTKQFVNFPCAIKIAPTLPVVRVAAFVLQIAASANKEKWPRRGKSKQFVMIVLKAGTRAVRVQHAEHGVFFGRNIIVGPQPIEIPGLIVVGSAIHGYMRIDGNRSRYFRRESTDVDRGLGAERKANEANLFWVNIRQAAKVFGFARTSYTMRLIGSQCPNRCRCLSAASAAFVAASR